MASATAVEEKDDGREKQRYKENKVYTRRSFKGRKKNNLVDSSTNNIDGNGGNNSNNGSSVAVNNSIFTTTSAPTTLHHEDSMNDKNISNGNNDNNSAEAPAQPLPLEYRDSPHQQPALREDNLVDSTTNNINTINGGSNNNSSAVNNSIVTTATPTTVHNEENTNDKNNENTNDDNNSAEAPAEPLPLENRDSAHQQLAPHEDILVDSTTNNINTKNGDNNSNNNSSTAVNISIVTTTATHTIVHDEDDTNDETDNNFAEALAHQQPAPRVDTVVFDDSSSLKKHHIVADNGAVNPGLESQVKINLASRSKKEMWELRKKLEGELDLVRNLVKRIEVKEAEISTSHVPLNDSLDYGFQRVQPEVTVVSTPHQPVKQFRPLNQLDIPVLEKSQGMNENLEKEKRTPKANQFYRNSEFLLAKDKFPPAESNKKLKLNGKKQGGGELTRGFGVGNKCFKSCISLLERLMKHKHGWVFNVPVDVKGLGLHDYYTIIKQPMDLGTVKSRLNKNWYKSPREFAEDVRLTFRNAMTYNPKGQDVHIMAGQLLQIFEDKWVTIEANYIRDMRLAMEYEVSLPMPTPRKAHPMLPPPLDTRRILDRPNSMIFPDGLRSKPIATTPSGRIPAPKKPKAKDLYKRDMTYEEKEKLSTNLQGLPSEKLDSIVQIIKKRNTALFQHDDEIEVDIDSVDTETLWELDRFITNYKKSLSKNKRKAELAIQARAKAEQIVPKKLQTAAPVSVELPKGASTNEQNMITSRIEVEKQGDNASRSSSSSSSSSDSESSSSDSDSGSSSASKSDAGHSPRS